jgi:hypothetical protein
MLPLGSSAESRIRAAGFGDFIGHPGSAGDEEYFIFD